MKQVDLNELHNSAKEKKIEYEVVELKNVLTPSSKRDIKAEMLPIDERNEEHTEFLFNYADFQGRQVSPFKTNNDVAREYVRLFMRRTGEQEQDENSDFSCVIKDLRACRILFYRESMQLAVENFFVNA